MTGNMDILENMRKMLEAGKISKEDIERAFPELAEFEDKMIRKAIGAAICGTTAETVLEANGVKLVEALAYLEKQKEFLTPEEKMKHPLYVEGFEAGKQIGTQYEAVFGKQKEQKPIIIIPKFRVGDEIKTQKEESLIITKIDYEGYWSEDLFICNFDEEYIWDLAEQKPAEDKDAIEPTPKQDYSGLTDFERAIHRGFLCAGVENVPVGIIKDTAQDCLTLIEQPAEWSKEDEAAFGDLMWCIEQARKSAKDENDMGNIWLAEKWVKEHIKSFSPQSKAEWSEKDKEMLFFLNEFMDNKGKDYFSTLVYPKIKIWLKSLRPKPHWKPSEEQMKALSWAINYLTDIEQGCASTLALLKFDLKSL